MSRPPRKPRTLKLGGIYPLDGRFCPIPLFTNVVSRQRSKNWKHVNCYLDCGEFNVFVLREETFFGNDYVFVMAFSKTGKSDVAQVGYLSKPDLLRVIGKSTR